MWQLVKAEWFYQRGRALGFLAGVLAVSVLIATMVELDHSGEYFMFPSLLLLAGILMHISTLWDADAEHRETLLAQLPVSRLRAAGAKLLAPVLFQMVALGAALTTWSLLVWSGAVDEGTGTESWWFLAAANGAALAFLIGWAHLAPEVDAAKQQSPRLALFVAGISVVIVLGVTAWAFSPFPLQSPLAISFGVAAAIFYSLAAVVAVLKLWLYVRRRELT